MPETVVVVTGMGAATGGLVGAGAVATAVVAAPLLTAVGVGIVVGGGAGFFVSILYVFVVLSG